MGEEINLAVFTARPDPVIFRNQPTRTNQSETDPDRRNIPISTIDWQTLHSSHFLPINGLDFLLEADKLLIQQQVELIDVMENVESENRYSVKVPRGETIYYATETSNLRQRTWLGSNRAFELRLFDPTQQLAIIFQRRLACGACCSCCCYLQILEVFVPSGEIIGSIHQQTHLKYPTFLAMDRSDNVLFKIQGPESFLCFLSKNQHFQIFTPDGTTQVGSVVHQWDNVQVAYNLLLQLPGQQLTTEDKAILLGAAFLLEYMYFENEKRRSCCNVM